MSTDQYSQIVFNRDDVNVLAYVDGQSPKPTIVVDFEGLEVSVYESPTDGRLSIQVETVNKKQLENLRVQVEEKVVLGGTVNNISTPAENTNYTVLFNDGQTHNKKD